MMCVVVYAKNQRPYFFDNLQNQKVDSLLGYALKLSKEQPKASFPKYLVSLAYKKKALSCDSIHLIPQLKLFLDSSIQYLNIAKELLNKKELKSSFLEYMRASEDSKKIENNADIQFNYIKNKLQKSTEDLIAFKKEVESLENLYAKLQNAHRQSVTHYQHLLANSSLAEIFLSNIALFNEKTHLLAESSQNTNSILQNYLYFAQKLSIYPKTVTWKSIFNEKRFLKSDLDSISIANLHLEDFNEWIDKVKSYRNQQIPQIRKEISQSEEMLEELLQKSLSQEIPDANIPEVSQLVPPLKVIEPNSIIFYWWNYKISIIRLNSLFVKEKGMYDYANKEEEVISTYYSIKSSAKESIKLLADLKTASLFPSVSYHEDFFKNKGGKDGLAEFIKKERIDLLTKEQYCSIRIKDRLLYQQQRGRYMPRFAIYKGYKIPLFEQPLDAITENGGYVTTKVISNDNEEMYITGYRKVSTKQAFIAKVKLDKILWIKHLSDISPGDEAMALTNSYGTLLSLSQGSCFAVIHTDARQDDELPKNKLFEVDVKNGNHLKIMKLEDGESPLGLLFNKEKSSYLSATEKLVYDTQLPSKSLVIKEFDEKGNIIWERNLHNSNLAKIISLENEYVVVCNKEVENDFTSETEVQGPPQTFSKKKNLLLVKINNQGEIVAQKQIESNSSHYATYVSVLEDQNILIVGFRGNGLERMQQQIGQIFDMLVDKDLKVLYSSL
ncbi:MAG: hypothetical protein OHK0038_12680 [Flammeovirgaceae bacterium]